MHAKLRDWSLLVLCNSIWASQFVLVKIVQEAMGPFSATLLPMLLATLLLLIAVYVEAKIHSQSVKNLLLGLRLADYLGFLAIGVFGQFIAQVFATWGTRDNLASNSALLMLSLPVLTAFMGYLILGEKMSLLRWISFAFAILGAILASGIDWGNLDVVNPEYSIGNAMIILSAAGSAFYNVYSKKLLVRYSPLQVLLGSYLVLIVALTPITLHSEPEIIDNLTRFPGKVWLGLIMLGALVYFAAMLMFLSVLKRLDAIQAGLSNYLIPVIGVLIACAVLRERLSPWAMVGGAVVFLSTLLITVAESLQSPKGTQSNTPNPIGGVSD